jgi:UDP-glucose 4-epimerase
MPPICQANPYLGFRVNAEGTVMMLEAARLLGVQRIVCMSSKAAYGPITGEHAYPTYRPVTEDYPRNPTNVYGATKLTVEHMGLEYLRSHGVDFVALRLSSTYGPGKQERHGAVGIPALVVENAFFRRTTRLAQGADERNDLIYNRDVARAIVLAGYATGLQHRIFNISSGELTTIGDLVAILQEFIPGTTAEIGPGLNYMQTDKPSYCLMDLSRARQELGYEPHYNLRRGVEDYLAILERLGSPAAV